MLNLIIRKWIEPYMLLETIKEYASTEEFSFDGSNKAILKQHFLKQLRDTKAFGLYMKNVNKFYLFSGNIDIDKIFSLTSSDYEITDNIEIPFEMVDMGKAEAGIIKT